MKACLRVGSTRFSYASDAGEELLGMCFQQLFFHVCIGLRDLLNVTTATTVSLTGFDSRAAAADVARLDTRDPPEDGQLRMWWATNLCRPQFYSIRDLEHALLLADVFENFEAKIVKLVYSNRANLDVFRSGSWQEWRNDNGQDFPSMRMR